MPAKLLRSLTLLVALLALGINACSSSATRSNSGTSISGTAATGAPLIGLITVKDANGQMRRVQSGADGRFTIPTTGLTPPLMLEATPAAGGEVLFSFSESLTGC